MPGVQFGVSAYDSNQYGLPVIKLENWYPEFKPGIGQVRLLPTPGLTRKVEAAEGFRGAFQADGALNDAIVIADGTKVKTYAEDGTLTTLGTVLADSYRAQFAASQTDVVMVSGGIPYTVNATQGPVPFAISTATGPIIAVAEYAQRFIFLEGGSGRIHASDVAQPTRVVTFATAESDPDNVLTLDVHAGSIYVGGSETVELWTYTGSTASPFISRPGATLPFGVIGRDATAKADFGLFMVASDGLVYRIDSEIRRISTHDLERRIKSLSKANQALVSLSAHVWNGHPFVRINLPGVGSWMYDVATETVHRQKTLDVEEHKIRQYVEAFGNVYGAGPGGLYLLENETYTEEGANVRRVATAIVPVEDGRPRIDRLTVYTSAADETLTETPQAMLRVATDTRTFDTELMRDLPLTGEYGKAVEWGPIYGLVPPALVMELAISDPAGVTLADAKLNMARS